MKIIKILLVLIIVIIVGIWLINRYLVTDQLLTAEINNQEFNLTIVDEPEEWIVGLSQQQDLAVDQAMLFIFPDKQIRSFWMRDMKFPIDLIWLDGQIVVGWEENMLVPAINTAEEDLPRYVSPQLVDQVLELPAGTISNLNLQIGNIINF